MFKLSTRNLNKRLPRNKEYGNSYNWDWKWDFPNILIMYYLSAFPISAIVTARLFDLPWSELPMDEYNILGKRLYSVSGIVRVFTFFTFMLGLPNLFLCSIVLTTYLLRISAWVYSYSFSAYLITLTGCAVLVVPLIYVYGPKYFSFKVSDDVLELIFGAVGAGRYTLPWTILYFIVYVFPIWGRRDTFLDLYLIVFAFCWKRKKFYDFLQERALPLAEENKDIRFMDTMKGLVYTFRSVLLIFVLLATYRVLFFAFDGVCPNCENCPWCVGYFFITLVYLCMLTHMTSGGLLVISLFVWGRLNREARSTLIILFRVAVVVWAYLFSSYPI